MVGFAHILYPSPGVAIAAFAEILSNQNEFLPRTS